MAEGANYFKFARRRVSGWGTVSCIAELRRIQNKTCVPFSIVDRTVSDESVQELSKDAELEVGDRRGTSAVGGGVRGVVAVLDDGQEMDRFSCDLVKVQHSVFVMNISADTLGLRTAQSGFPAR